MQLKILFKNNFLSHLGEKETEAVIITEEWYKDQQKWFCYQKVGETGEREVN